MTLSDCCWGEKQTWGGMKRFRYDTSVNERTGSGAILGNASSPEAFQVLIGAVFLRLFPPLSLTAGNASWFFYSLKSFTLTELIFFLLEVRSMQRSEKRPHWFPVK